MVNLAKRRATRTGKVTRRIVTGRDRMTTRHLMTTGDYSILNGQGTMLQRVPCDANLK
jgi:hypothetical protein